MNPNILDHHPVIVDENEQMVFVQIEEDEDQGFGAQFNDDCPSSDEENNHRSTLSLTDHRPDHHWLNWKTKSLQRSQSDSDFFPNRYQRFFSLPNLFNQSRAQYEKIEHFIIDDQQPTTTISNLIIKKKQDEDDEEEEDDEKEISTLRKKKIWRKSSEEILEISNQEATPQVEISCFFFFFFSFDQQ